MKIVASVTPAPREAWEAAFAADPLALETQSPSWADAMCAQRGFEDVSLLYQTDEGRDLVFPMLRRRLARGLPAIEGSMLRSCGVGGVVAAGGPSQEEIAAVFHELARRASTYLTIYPNPLLAESWAKDLPAAAISIPRRAHVMDLEGGFEQVWKHRFSSSTRTAVRKAEREGVTVECDTTGRLMGEYYGLMELAVQRWAAAQHEPPWLARLRLHQRDPLQRMEAIARTLGDRCRVWLARVDGRPAGGFIVLQGANGYGFRAAMDEELKRYHAHDLLVRHIVEDVCNSGCHYYYLGSSGWSTSRSVFKERVGARPVVYAEYRLERFPVTAVERVAKQAVKKLVRFRD